MVGSLARKVMETKNCAKVNLPSKNRQIDRKTFPHTTFQTGDRSTDIYRVHGTPRHVLRFIDPPGWRQTRIRVRHYNLSRWRAHTATPEGSL